MPLWLTKIIATRIIKFIKHKIDLKKIDKYVNKPNELDNKIGNLEVLVTKLLETSHSPIFKKNDYRKILKRLTKLEKKEK